MSTSYQIEDQNGIYFITHTVVDWVDVFTRQVYRDIVIDSLQYCCENKGLEIFAWVIMSNHMHLIVRSATGKQSDTIRDYKRFTATNIIEQIRKGPESRAEWMLHRFAWNGSRNTRNTENQFWIQDNHPEAIYSNDFFCKNSTIFTKTP